MTALKRDFAALSLCDWSLILHRKHPTFYTM